MEVKLAGDVVSEIISLPVNAKYLFDHLLMCDIKPQNTSLYYLTLSNPGSFKSFLHHSMFRFDDINVQRYLLIDNVRYAV